ncbi:GNAT family N-acetyltransferase [Streptomyces nanshensis]|uniref:BioF2-like acetyltransferase domain-containing protein n=1 Tax=Streptomyces nanshensis TaxID=518642 RepID=A0A1E7LAP5_9ACTN|nr:GNAT family N-acetyltransferase [Streptomyces nanshensis]OEV13305.1 hypothetical protein AN218_04140 [Streptomyces nanshensis]
MTSVRILRGLDARRFLAAPDHWQRLLADDRYATPYQSSAWLSAWAGHLPPTATPLVLVAEEAARPVAALALVREHLYGRGRITPLGAPTADYIRPVGRRADDIDAVSALVETLAGFVRDGESVRLSDVPLSSTLGWYIASQREWRRTTTDCAAVRLPVHYGQLSRDTRRSHQRRRRAWRDLVDGGHQVRIDRCSGSALLPAWDILLDLHRSRWGALPAAEAQLTDVLTHAASSGAAFIEVLRMNGVPLAAQLCLTRHRSAYSLLTAMSDGYRDLAPGHCLLRWLAATLYRDGYEVLDTGRIRPEEGQRRYRRQYDSVIASTVTADLVPTTPARRTPAVATLQGAA